MKAIRTSCNYGIFRANDMVRFHKYPDTNKLQRVSGDIWKVLCVFPSDGNASG